MLTDKKPSEHGDHMIMLSLKKDAQGSRKDSSPAKNFELDLDDEDEFLKRP
jgi:hypothetical protein